MPGVEPGSLPPGRAEAGGAAAGDGHRPRTAPFQAGTDPGLLWRSRRHQELLDQLASGVRDQGGVLLLTGDVGTGKTILAKALLERLRPDMLVATVVYARHDALDFSKEIGEAWGVGESAATRETFYAHLPAFLDDAAARGKRVLLFVDEAQTLSQDLFAEIGRLAIVAGESRSGQARLSILLVGQDTLESTLARPENTALAKRITVRCMTAPLTPAEVREYVAHQLRGTGAGPPALTEDAIQEIATASQGIPRLINTIADLAVLSSVQRSAPTVDAEAVRQSARMLGHPVGHTARARPRRARARRRTAPGHRGPARRAVLYVPILVVLLASGGYLYISGAPRDRDARQAPRTNTLPVSPAFSNRPVSEGVAETIPFAQATDTVPAALPKPEPLTPEGPAPPTLDRAPAGQPPSAPRPPLSAPSDRTPGPPARPVTVEPPQGASVAGPPPVPRTQEPPSAPPPPAPRPPLSAPSDRTPGPPTRPVTVEPPREAPVAAVPAMPRIQEPPSAPPPAAPRPPLSPSDRTPGPPARPVTVEPPREAPVAAVPAMPRIQEPPSAPPPAGPTARTRTSRSSGEFDAIDPNGIIDWLLSEYPARRQ